MAQIKPASLPSTLDESSLAPQLKQNLEQIAKAIRGLSIDAVEKAKSGHPGLPLGCAQIAAYLYGYFLNHYPQVPEWIARDRFVLSAGHGSMLLYSSLHLSGFNLPLEHLKNFRQLHSLTPGHPEYMHTEGVETTTGPLGQGLATAVGQAIGLKMAQAQIGGLKALINSPKVIALTGDGCMMEGISHEACSLAAHLSLDNLIVIYDSNDVCLDGPLNECFTEDVKARFEAYGWQVLQINGHDLDSIHSALKPLKTAQEKPVLIIAKTIIGYGSPHKGGTSEAHGAPLGSEEAALTKQALGLSSETFYVDGQVRDYFTKRLESQKNTYLSWLEKFHQWAQDHIQQAALIQAYLAKDLPLALEQDLRAVQVKSSVASRSSSATVLNYLAQRLPWIVGGSADLSCSDNTFIHGTKVVSKNDFSGRNIKYGVREFAMAGIANGICQSHFFTPFIGTFLTFSDYMRNAIRLCALMRLRIIYQFTHDSIFLGEDGPTHQPVEHIASLRMIPGLQVIRPADSNEVKMAWLAALRYEGPTALILSRQALPDIAMTNRGFIEGLGRGAYVILEEPNYQWTLFATGSEVALALDVAQALNKNFGVGCRVVSMPCHMLFELQDDAYKAQILGPTYIRRMSIEAGTSFGWHKYIGSNGLAISIDEFGASAPMKDLKEEFGFTVPKILKRMGYSLEAH